MPDACPGCGTVRDYQRDRCAQCPVTGLEKAMQCPAGKLLAHVADLDAMLHCPGFAITADQIDVYEWRALRVLWDERDKYIVDERKRQEAEARSEQHRQSAASQPTRR